MGLFSFIKDAGENQIVQNINNATALEKTDKNPKTEPISERLRKTIEHYKLSVDNLKITIDEDMAVVCGKVSDQSTKEKVVLIIGNTTGIASVDDQMIVDHAENESQFHCVEKDETLSTIAKHYYRDSQKHLLILEANAPMLNNTGSIYPGQVLRIPNLE